MAKRSAMIVAALALVAATEPTGLAVFQPGQWVLKSRDDPAENRNLCVKDVRALLQVRHGAAVCSRFVISSTPKELTVHYTCPGLGHGRTTIRAETGSLIQVESQGIADKQPFALMLEGRRTGDCPASLSRAPR